MIQEKTGMGAKIKPGGMGQFDVLVDGQKVIGKTGDRFPTEVEIVNAVKGTQG